MKKKIQQISVDHTSLHFKVYLSVGNLYSESFLISSSRRLFHYVGASSYNREKCITPPFCTKILRLLLLPPYTHSNSPDDGHVNGNSSPQDSQLVAMEINLLSCAPNWLSFRWFNFLLMLVCSSN